AARGRPLGARAEAGEPLLGTVPARSLPALRAARRRALEGDPRGPSGDRAGRARPASRGVAVRAPATARDPLIAELESARRFLKQVVDPVAEELWVRQPSPAYSPIGWHLGHVASVQARWLLPGEPQEYEQLFDPAAVAKAARGKLPKPSELRCLLDDVLERVCAGLRAGRVPGVLGLPESFLVQHVAQHELQHAEHVQVIAALFEKRLHRMPPP